MDELMEMDGEMLDQLFMDWSDNEQHENENQNKKERNYKCKKYLPRTIKTTLGAILQHEHKKEIMNEIADMSIRSTKIQRLGSLLLLTKIRRSIDNNKLQFFDSRPLVVVKKCMYAICLEEERTNNDFLIEEPEFINAMEKYCIQFPSRKRLNNIMNNTVNDYEARFRTNIKEHARQRFFKYFKMQDETLTKADIDPTLNFMIHKNTKSVPNIDLIVSVPYIELLANHNQPGFLTAAFNNNWFQTVPVFIGIQKAIHMNEIRREKAEWITPFKNFNVVPIMNCQRKHVRIDSCQLYSIITYLKITQQIDSTKKIGKKTNVTQLSFSNKKDENDRVEGWFKYFSIDRIKQMERKSKSFNYDINTDGIACSTDFVYKRETFKSANENQIQYNSKNDKYSTVCGMDPGYKIFIGAVIANLTTGEETNYRLTSKRFHQKTGMQNRENKAFRLTADFILKSREDRQDRCLYPRIPSPKNVRWFDYVDHSLKMFNEEIEVYTDKKYTRLRLDKYFQTQRVMDEIVNKLTKKDDNRRCLICIGSTEFSANSPIRGYVRCPGTKLIVKQLKKVLYCDVYFVDEYRTTKTCSRCFKLFDEQLCRKIDRQRHRYRVCDNCIPSNEFQSYASIINTPKNHRREENHLNSNNGVEAVITKMNQFVKQNPLLNLQNHPEKITKIVWNRDTNAARNILFKGNDFIHFFVV